MKRVIIFGNSGSGKSTMAKKICSEYRLEHLDLDTLAWLPSSPPERRLLADSESDISDFISSHDEWVIEGCYSDLLELALDESNELIFMNLPVEECVLNAKNRPWEPHKYKSKEAQDSNLDMLIDWISQYSKRTDTFSKAAHKEIYERYKGSKRMITCNDNDYFE